MKPFLRSIYQTLIVGISGLVACFCATAVGAEDGWGTLKGQIVISGDALEIPLERVGDHPDKAICLVDGKLPEDDNIVVDKNGGLSDVFVMMYVKGRGADAPIHQSYSSDDKDEELSIDNVKCRFVPHAVYVRAGQSVLLKNSDSVGHNCHITTFNNEHNVNLPAGGEVKIELKSPDKFPGMLKCDLHTWMDAVLLVRDNPYVGITDSAGKFEIKNVPAGEWEFQFWHNKSGYMKKLQSDKYKFGRKGETKVEITNEGETDMGKLEFPTKAFK